MALRVHCPSVWRMLPNLPYWILIAQRQRIDSRLVNAWIESFFDRYTFAAERVEDSWRYGFERTSAPEEVPLFRSLEVDRQGNVCAERYGPTETATWVYWCFTPDGRFARRVVLPNDFKRVAGFPHLDPQIEIGREYVLGIRVDPLGVERVQLLALRASAGHPEIVPF